MPIPVARRAPRAGQRPRPRPGEGRPRGGEKEAATLRLKSPVLPHRDRTLTLDQNLSGALHDVGSLLGEAVLLDPP